MKKKEEKCDYRITALNKKGETVPAPKQQKLKDEFIRVHIKEHKSPKPEKKYYCHKTCEVEGKLDFMLHSQPKPEQKCMCELDGFQGAMNTQYCPIHKPKEKKCKQITHISLQTKKDINKPTKGVRMEEIPIFDRCDCQMCHQTKILATKINEVIKVLNSR